MRVNKPKTKGFQPPLHTHAPLRRRVGCGAGCRKNVSIYDAHMQDKAHTQWKVQEMKRQKEEAELALCTFQPQTYLAGPFISKHHPKGKTDKKAAACPKPGSSEAGVRRITIQSNARGEPPAEAAEAEAAEVRSLVPR